MNIYLNKDYLKFRKINNRYLKFNNKPEKQTMMSENFNNFNKYNLTKQNNVYNSNYFSVNKFGIYKNNLNNYNNIKKDNSLKLNSLVNPPKINNSNNNLKLSITNFKNSNSKIISSKRDININEIKEENKINNNLFKKNNEEIPTILKVQKLIEALQNKNTTDNNSISLKNVMSFDNKNNTIVKNTENNIINKKVDKLPSLINDMKTNFKQQKEEKNELKIFPVKDMINRVNHTKIKLKNINHETHLIVKHPNKNRDENTHNIKIKAKDLPVPKPRKPKVSINHIKNMIKDDLIINNNGSYEKIVNIRLKLNPKNQRNYFNESIYQNNSLSLMKTKKDSVNFCLSNYNNYQNNLMVLKQTFHNIESERTKKEKFFNKNQTMFKNPLNEKKLKEENEELDSDGEEDSKRFSKYFLPSSGFGLLQRHNN